MRVVLISAPSQSLDALRQPPIFSLVDAPLGVLTLASILESQGLDVELADLDAELHQHLLGAATVEEFHSCVLAKLARDSADIFGFSSLCSSFPATLRLASELKHHRPDARIILGGPQASVVDESTLRAFPSIDFVLRGEADQSLPQLLDAINSSNPFFDFVPGLTFRRNGEIRRNAPGGPLLDMDWLPLPAFHLYKDQQCIPEAPLELGRGCPFACKFCSTNDFFRRKFRLKAPAKVLEQMRLMNRLYGTKDFSLVHDMFTVNRQAVIAFAETMRDSGEHFRWFCSARTDCVDPLLLKAMREGGCAGVFFGIETGSARLQRIVDKNLDLDEAQFNVAEADHLGIRTTVSLITGFPEETPSDFRDTIDFLMQAARQDTVRPQLHLLAPLAGTPIETRFRGQLMFGGEVSDISPLLDGRGPESDWIERYPDIFPNFYAVPCELDREYLCGVREFVLTGLRVVRWLFLALHQTTGTILDVYRDAPTRSLDTRQQVYAFLQFVEERYGHHNSVAALVHYYRLLLAFRSPSEAADCKALSTIESHSRPVFRPGVKLSQLAPCLLDHVRSGTCLEFTVTPAQTVAVKPTERNGIELKLLHPIVAHLLQTLEPGTTVARLAQNQVVAGFARQFRCGSLELVKTVLEELQDDGLIWFTSHLDESSFALSPPLSPVVSQNSVDLRL